MSTNAQPDVTRTEDLVHQDIYFLDPGTAMVTALCGNLVDTSAGPRLQLCYYHGQPVQDGPVNLIPVPSSQFGSFFIESDFPLPTQVCLPGGDAPADEQREMSAAFGEMLAQVARARRDRAKKPLKFSPHKDAYFLDARQAFYAAIKQHEVYLGHPTIPGLQVCYHDGPPMPGAPGNMVSVPLETMVEYFSHTRKRFPDTLVLPADLDAEFQQRFNKTFSEGLMEAVELRCDYAKQLLDICKSQRPEPASRLRVLFLASRLTQVMQYSSKGLAAAFAELGHDTLLIMESDATEQLDSAVQLAEQVKFNPHLVVNINHLNNHFISPEVHNVVWFQDPTQDLQNRTPIKLRERDYVFSFSGQLDGMLRECGVKSITRQHFCIDTEIFQHSGDEPRRRKVVFVGSNTQHFLKDKPGEGEVLQEMERVLSDGQAVTDEMLRGWADSRGLDYDYVCWHLFYHVVRQLTVHWLCGLKDIEVEVYGRYWESDPLVRPFFRGEVSHGEQLASLYRSAEYAMVSHAFDLHSQRLAEVCACGCTPLVWDCRALTEEPYWEDHLLYFNTASQLTGQIGRRPPRLPSEVASEFTYEHMVNRILEIIHWQGQDSQ